MRCAQLRFGGALALLVVLAEGVAFVEELESDRVSHLPGVESKNLGTQFAGYLNATHGERGVSLFYVLVEHGDHDSNLPLVLWLQGGPGASSLFSYFFETGPHTFADPPGSEPHLSARPSPWSEVANILYIDSPVGTGFSFCQQESKETCYAKDEATLAADVHAALSSFLEKHPRYVDRAFYIFGESYAGKMAPNIASGLSTAGVRLELRGVGLGDGWVDPVHQNRALVTYALSTGLIGRNQARKLQPTVDACVSAIQRHAYVEAYDKYCYYHILNAVATANVSVYDVRKLHDTSAQQSQWMGDYLTRDDVVSALHASSVRPFDADVTGVESALIADLNAPTATPHLAPLLNAGVQLLVYSGQFDLICNLVGTDAWVDDLTWNHTTAFASAERSPWIVNGQVLGWKQEGGGLTRIVVADAGHMAPGDQPLAGQHLLRHLIATTKLAKKE